MRKIATLLPTSLAALLLIFGGAGILISRPAHLSVNPSEFTSRRTPMISLRSRSIRLVASPSLRIFALSIFLAGFSGEWKSYRTRVIRA